MKRIIKRLKKLIDERNECKTNGINYYHSKCPSCGYGGYQDNDTGFQINACRGCGDSYLTDLPYTDEIIDIFVEIECELDTDLELDMNNPKIIQYVEDILSH